MTAKNHSRKVTVNRRSKAAEPTRKAVTVRLRDDGPTKAVPAPSAEREIVILTAQAVAVEAAAPAEAAPETVSAAESLPTRETSPAEVAPVDHAPQASEPIPAVTEEPAAQETAEASPQTSADAESASPQDVPADDESNDTLPPAETGEDPPVGRSASQHDEPPHCDAPTEPTGSDDKPQAVAEPIARDDKPHAVAEADCDTPIEAVGKPEQIADDSADPAAVSPPAGKWYIPQKWHDISLLRKLIMILSVALALFSMLPLTVGIMTPGILPPLMIAAFFLCCALYWPVIDRCESTWGNVLIAVVAVCVLAGVTYLSFVSGKMISASANTLPEDRGDVTVVVLGCRVKGDQPSRMLHARLEKASEFLLEHPQAHCIVTGGRGPDEDYPEAYVMKNYLVGKGVSPMRIIMEDKSTSTLENITFASDLTDVYNCHNRFLIVTDRFHQYRAVTAANDLGIVSYALNVETAWYLVMPYWFREMAAITRDWLVG